MLRSFYSHGDPSWGNLCTWKSSMLRGAFTSRRPACWGSLSTWGIQLHVGRNLCTQGREFAKHSHRCPPTVSWEEAGVTGGRQCYQNMQEGKMWSYGKVHCRLLVVAAYDTEPKHRSLLVCSLMFFILGASNPHLLPV